MESKAKLFGHSVHQMLIVSPLGTLATAVVFDLIYFAGDSLVFADAPSSLHAKRGEAVAGPR